MTRESFDEVSKPDAMDAGQMVVRAAVASVPVLGSAATELMGFVVTPPLEARRNQWLNDLARDLDELRERLDGFDPAGLSYNDDFLGAVAIGVGAATRSAQAEKRAMLRNAVLNSALGNVPDFDMQSVFINYLEYLSPMHLRVLALFRDPKTELLARGIDIEDRYMSGGLSTVLEEGIPELKGRRDTYDFLWQDLYQRRLVNTDGLHTTMTASGMVASRTSPLGNQFLDYVARPAVLEESSSTA